MIKSSIQITTDSMCDLPTQLYNKYDIHVIYNRIITNYGDFYDIKEITSSNLIEYLSSEQDNVKTFCPSVQEYHDFFERELESAQKVLHIASSSNINNSYNNAVAAAEGNDNIYVIDSLQISGGIGILVLVAAFLYISNNNIHEIISKLNNYKSGIQAKAVVHSMKYFQPDHFRKNISFRTFLMKLLNHSFIHPLFRLSKGGLEMRSVYIGNIQNYCIRFVRNEFHKKNNIDKRLLVITYADCPYNVIKMIRNEISRYIEFEHIVTAPMSAVTTSHCGSNTIALFYVTIN